MKENAENNEAFVALHEKMRAEGKSTEEIVQAAIETFNLKGKNPRHTYRAVKSRLFNTNKYGGRFHERMKPFMAVREKTSDDPALAPEGTSTDVAPTIKADAVVETPEALLEASTQA